MVAEMALQESLEVVISAAIQRAHVNDPDTGSGTMWEAIYISDEVSHHFARSILRALAKMELTIVPKEQSDAPRP
jgi:hypothetical protein